MTHNLFPVTSVNANYSSNVLPAETSHSASSQLSPKYVSISALMLWKWLTVDCQGDVTLVDTPINFMQLCAQPITQLHTRVGCRPTKFSPLAFPPTNILLSYKILLHSQSSFPLPTILPTHNIIPHSHDHDTFTHILPTHKHPSPPADIIHTHKHSSSSTHIPPHSRASIPIHKSERHANHSYICMILALLSVLQ